MIVSMFGMLLAAQLRIAAMSTEPPEVVTEYVTEYVEVPYYVTEYIEVPTVEYVTETAECGACGAHIEEWYYVQSQSSGEPIEVCRDCYENYVACL